VALGLGQQRAHQARAMRRVRAQVVRDDDGHPPPLARAGQRGAGSSCSATVTSTSATTVQYTAYLAQPCYPGCSSDAQSAPISVSWQ
jgi:hypothetical protein